MVIAALWALDPMAIRGCASMFLSGFVGSLSNPTNQTKKGKAYMSLTTLLIVLLVLALIGVMPTWGYSSGWGYWPSGGLGLVLLILIILLLMGRI